MKAPRERKLGPGGFTLVEMLVAITIVLIFGAMAAETLKEGAGMWRTGYRRSYAYDTSTAIFQQIQDDLSAAKSQYWGGEANAYDKNVKFWADFDTYTDPQGNVSKRQWMRFVRAMPDYNADPRVRNAGTVATATGYYNLKPPASVTDNDLRPLEGTCEVAYMMGLGGVTDPTALYRAVLAPIGRTPAGGVTDPGMTFFNADGGAGDPLSTSALIDQKALPIAQGVIHFEVRLWSQYTWGPSGAPWQPSLLGYKAAGETATAFAAWANSYSPVNSGSLYRWNSDRVSLAGTPQFPMSWGQPGFAPPVGSNYDTDPKIACDNVFPRAVMVVVTIEPPNELSVANPLRLLTGTSDVGTQLHIIGDAPPMNDQWPFVKIGDEWIRVNPVIDQTTNVMYVVDEATGLENVTGRGVRGTARASHNAGDRVLVGYTFTRVFDYPAAREYWGQ